MITKQTNFCSFVFINSACFFAFIYRLCYPCAYTPMDRFSRNMLTPQTQSQIPPSCSSSLQQHFDRSPTLKAIYQYWLSLCRNATPPTFIHFDPIEIPTLLPHLMIWSVEPIKDSFQFKNKLIGQSINLVAQDILEKQYLHHLFPTEWYNNWEPTFLKCVTKNQLYYGRSHTFSKEEKTAIIDWILLPLVSSDHKVNLIMGGLSFVEHDGRPLDFGKNFHTLIE